MRRIQTHSFCSSPKPALIRLMLGFLCFTLTQNLRAEHHESLATQTPQLSLEAALHLALQDNPGLQEIKARAEASTHVPSQEGSLPDPELSFGALNLPSNTFNLHQEDMTMMALGISQQFPFPGKLGLKEKISSILSEIEASTVQDARIQLARNVKFAWWRIFYLDRAAEIVSQSQGSIEELVKLAMASYRAGSAPQQDVLLAQMENSKYKERRIEILNMRHIEAARLNALLNLPGNRPVTLPREGQIIKPEVKDDRVLFQTADAVQPRIVQKRKNIEAAQSRLELAEKEFWPDLKFGTGYAFRQSTTIGTPRSDFVDFQLSINLPLYAAQKQSRGVDQRQTELLKEEFALQDELRRLDAEITESLVTYQHANERFELYKSEIVPQAKQTVDVLLVSYRSGQTDMTSLLRAFTQLFEYEVLYWENLTQGQQALATLAAAIGEVPAYEQ